MYTQTTCISSFFKGIPNNHDQINVRSSLDFIDQKSNDSSAHERMLHLPKWNDKILSGYSSTNYILHPSRHTHKREKLYPTSHVTLVMFTVSFGSNM